MNNHLNEFIKRKKLKKSDIIKIIHILDTDGVYIPEGNIIVNNNLSNYRDYGSFQR